MSIQEQKITEAAIAASGVQSRPDKLTGTTAAAQLVITTIPGFSAGNVQTALEQIVQAMQDVTQGSVTDGSITLCIM